jgi:hypothetical protein
MGFLFHFLTICDVSLVKWTGYVQWRTQDFFSGGGGVSTNSVEDREKRGRGSADGSPLVRGSAQFANE